MNLQLTMKKLTSCISIILLLFSSCSKNEDIFTDEVDNDIYKLTKISYYLEGGDGVIDTLWQRTDTLKEFNYTSIRQPNKIFFPYEKIRDTVSFVLEENSDLKNKIILNDSVKIPSTITNETVFMPVNYTKECLFPNSLVRNSTLNKTSCELSITPRTKYEIFGEYSIVRTKASFKALYHNEKTNNEITIKGQVYISRAENQIVKVYADNIK